MRLPLGLFLLVAILIFGFWRWLGMPVPMPASPLAAGEKLYCVSYAPFHGTQSPFDRSRPIDPAQIEKDLTQLAKIADCVRTYAVELNLDRVPAIAQRLGLKVLQGIWLGREAASNEREIAGAVALAKQYPQVIRAVIVGNEVLLRGEMSGAQLAATIRRVKAQVPVPVTYADVWEFWLLHPDLLSAVDLVTIHILPYWENDPIAAAHAAEHVAAIHDKVAKALPGKDVLIGEVGWPSAGRMREAALPSPADQARVLHDVVALAKKAKFDANIIEAYDQPWKRLLEGTVGGHWGLIDDANRAFKFRWGEPVSNHPRWLWQAGGGALFAALIFAAAALGRRRSAGAAARTWIAVALVALIAGGLIGWTVRNIPLESLGTGGWTRSLAMLGLALAAPLLAASALMRSRPLPSFSQVLGSWKRGSAGRPECLALAGGLVLAGVMLIAMQAALGLVFDPRYRDFPFAPLTGAAVPYLIWSLAGERPPGRYGLAELLAVGVLAACGLFVLFNEGFANWQSLWFCAALLIVVVTLVRAREPAAPG